MGLLGKVLGKVRLLRGQQRISEHAIEVAGTGIKANGLSIAWDDIGVISGYKIDLFTTDEIRLRLGFGSYEEVLELSEEQPGFDLFIQAAQTRLSFPNGWRERLTQPAFQRCEATLFRRET